MSYEAAGIKDLNLTGRGTGALRQCHIIGKKIIFHFMCFLQVHHMQLRLTGDLPAGVNVNLSIH